VGRNAAEAWGDISGNIALFRGSARSYRLPLLFSVFLIDS
jgi:hypothetical protein